MEFAVSVDSAVMPMIFNGAVVTTGFGLTGFHEVVELGKYRFTHFEFSLSAEPILGL